MKTQYTYTITWVLLMTLQFMLVHNFESKAQTADPGINFILVNFDQPPTNVTVEKAPLRYNKKFALSFHTDDGIGDVYTVGFPFFTGINEGGTNYPGLFYTDGCGNALSFKISTALFSFSSFNGLDMHDPANGFTNVTWDQLALMYENGSAIYNHGISEDGSSGDFMHYSIRRNESYIRRKLYGVTPGGVRTRILVNPNGNVDYTQGAFDNGYRIAFRVGGQVVTDNGVDVNSFSGWDQNLELNRRSAEDSPVTDLADFLATADGNWWLPLYGHSIINNYGETNFINDFNTIASNYGIAGDDNIWMTSEEEILDYLRISELTTLNYNVAGNTLLILLEGQIPTDQRFYPLSLLVDAENAVITNITINGGTNNTFNGIGSSSSLINLEWDGREIEDPEVLADQFVTIAENSQAEYDCLVAMDYVLMMPSGDAQQAMKDRLCAIPNVEYEAGFCETCDFDLGPDIEICQGECVLIEAPFAEGNTYLWSNDSTTSSILVCPEITTTYWVDLLTEGGCEASDTITINVLEAPVFDLGPDLEICQEESVSFELPFSADYTYLWIANDDTVAENVNEYSFVVQDTVTLIAQIGSPNGCITADTVVINALLKPQIDFGPDIDVCQEDSVSFELPFSADYSYLWIANNDTVAEDQHEYGFIVQDTVTLIAQIDPPNGCISIDTIVINALLKPQIAFTDTIFGCLNDSLEIQAPGGTDFTYNWYLNDEIQADTDSVFNVLLSDTLQVLVEVIPPNGCVAVDSTILVPVETPVFDFPDDTQVCINDTLTLEGPVCDNYTYFWYADDELLPETSFELNYIVTDTTQIILEVFAQSGCMTMDSLTVFALELPGITISPQQASLCFGEQITLSLSTQNAESFQWWDGSSEQTIIFDPPVADSMYLLWAEAVNGFGCLMRDTAYVTVQSKPEINLEITAGSDQFCSGEQLELSVSGNNHINPDYVVWNETDTVFFDGLSTLSRIFEPTANAWIKAEIFSEIGCSSADSLQVFVYETPEITVSEDSEVCFGTSINLVASGGESCEWYNSSGLIGSTFELTLVPEQSDSYYAIVSNGGPLFCSASDTVNVIVQPKPTVTATASETEVCAGTQIELAATGASSYTWSHGATGSPIFVFPLDTTTYQVFGSNEFGCVDTAEITVNVFPRTAVTIEGLLPVYCQSDEPTQVIGTPAGGLFSGPGMVAGVFNPEIAGDGTHNIYYILSNEYGCTDSATAKTIVFGGLSSIDLGSDTLICPNDTLRLNAGEGFADYYWNTGATTQQITILGTDYQAGTTREITVIGVLDGCTASGKMQLTIRDDCFISLDENTIDELKVSPNPGYGQFSVALPESFIPEQVGLIESNGKSIPFTYDLDNNKIEIRIRDHFQGLLILKLVSKSQTLTTKLMVY